MCSIPWAVEVCDVVFSLSSMGVSATGQMINQRLPVWRTVKDTEKKKHSLLTLKLNKTEWENTD